MAESLTRTASACSTVRLWWVCECCTRHGSVELVPQTVVCLECGQRCCCDGCAEDQNAIAAEPAGGRG